MTCEDCLYIGFCQNQYGDTDYFDDEEIITDVENCCNSFKDKADFVEVVHGEWIAEYEREGNYSHCSVCECRCQGYVPNYKYCPNCGAKMEEVRSDGKVY